MPYALIADKLGPLLSKQGVADLDADLVDQLRVPGSLINIAVTHGDLAPHEQGYFEAIPAPLIEAMRAAIVVAIDAGQAVHLQYSPGYDFEVRLWDYGDAISIHLSGPYPPDFPRGDFDPTLL
ncbi:MAG: hypothetical protein ABIX10_06115 [Acidimicrobiales bacterium]